MLAEVDDSSPEGADRAMNRFAIRLLMDADSFPTVFLVIEFQSCTVGRQDKVVRRGFWEASEGVPDSLYPISTRNWGTSDSMGSIFLVGGSSLLYPSIMI